MPEYQPPHVDKETGTPPSQDAWIGDWGSKELTIEIIELGARDFLHLRHHEDFDRATSDTDYYFIIRLIMVDYLPKWYRIDELVDMVQFVGSAPTLQRDCQSSGWMHRWISHPALVRDTAQVGNLTFSTSASARLHREGGLYWWPIKLYQLLPWALLEKWQASAWKTFVVSGCRAYIQNLPQRFEVDAEKAGHRPSPWLC